MFNVKHFGVGKMACKEQWEESRASTPPSSLFI